MRATGRGSVGRVLFFATVFHRLEEEKKGEEEETERRERRQRGGVSTSDVIV